MYLHVWTHSTSGVCLFACLNFKFNPQTNIGTFHLQISNQRCSCRQLSGNAIIGLSKLSLSANLWKIILVFTSNRFVCLFVRLFVC